MKTFKEVFCEHCKCSTEQYRQEILFRCMRPQNQFLLKSLLWWETSLIQEAIALVNEVGETTSLDQAQELVDEYRIRSGQRGSSRWFHFSTEKLLRVYSTLMTPNQTK